MSKENREFWRNVVAIILVVLLSIAGAAVYDNFAGGPEARQASVDAKVVLDGFSDIQDRSECVTSYTNADNVAQALLLISFGSIIESAALGEEITEEQTDVVHQARSERLRYLVLREAVSDNCDLKRRGGLNPLDPEDAPVIPELETING